MRELMECTITCKGCSTVLNHAKEVDQALKSYILVAAPLNVKRCPNGCPPTYSDCNANIHIDFREYKV